MKARYPFRLLPLLLVAILLFSACSRKVTFAREAGGYRNQKTNVLYRVAPNYRARAIDEKTPLGTYTSPGGTAVSLYAVEGLDAIADGDYTVYTAEGVSLPAFAELAVGSMDLCYSNAITYAYRSFGEADAARVQKALATAAQLPYSRVPADPSARYDLVFNASELPLSYRLVYLAFDEDVLVHAPLDADGSLPDLYPGVPCEKVTNASGGEEAVFRFGSQLLLDRATNVCYPIEDLHSNPEAE